MKVSKSWLKELVEVSDIDKLVDLLPLRTIGTKDVTDRYFELDMKGYNRADLLSMRGVAYESAAIISSKVKFEDQMPEIRSRGDLLHVEIENRSDCPIYCAAVVSGLKIGSSSESDQQKLLDCGLRPVNSLVDVTNLIMLEYGQPLHAFDGKSCLESDEYKIGVRRARSGELLTTLDGDKHQLSGEDIVITSGERILGLAGIMGGKDSEVGEFSDIIVLEAAVFDPVSLRRSANRQNIHSEAAKRFYHGLTKYRLMQAFNEALTRFESMGGEVQAVQMIGDLDQLEITIPLRVARVNSLIGVDINKKLIEENLNRLYFQINGGVVKPPFWRLDVQSEADLIEEVARMYGYENIPAKPLEGEKPIKYDQSRFEMAENIRSMLVDLGLSEILSYSFVSSKLLQAMGIDKELLIRVANPISTETEYMRESIWPNLVEKTIENLKYRQQVQIFEIGKIYRAVSGEVEESRVVSLAWSDGSIDPLTGLLSVINQLSESTGVKWQVQQSSGNQLFHPVRQVKITVEGDVVGNGGEVNQRLIDSLGGEQRVAVVEIKI